MQTNAHLVDEHFLYVQFLVLG